VAASIPPAVVLIPRLRHPLLTLFALLGLAARLHAVDATTEQTLTNARLEFERSLIEASLEPLKKQVIELDAIEKQKASARDYDGAIAVRTERRRLEGELERLDKQLLLIQTREQSLRSAALPDRISLPLEQAVLNGVRREGGEITGWSRTGTGAAWKLPALPPGGYEVVIRYRCGALDGGVLDVREARFHLSSPIETTLKGPREKNLGTLKVTDGSGTISLSASTLLKDNLMDLLGVWLIPAWR
jgi:hypothetical protein